jgi:hypothetical protein
MILQTDIADFYENANWEGESWNLSGGESMFFSVLCSAWKQFTIDTYMIV